MAITESDKKWLIVAAAVVVLIVVLYIVNEVEKAIKSGAASAADAAKAAWNKVAAAPHSAWEWLSGGAFDSPGQDFQGPPPTDQQLSDAIYSDQGNSLGFTNPSDLKNALAQFGQP